MAVVANFIICAVLLLLSGLKYSRTSACEQKPLLNDLSIRSPNHTSGGYSLSDHGLEVGWYSSTESDWQYVMTDEETMPTIGTCSTYWPIYLKGIHPDIEGLNETAVNATVCINNSGFLCAYSADIQIRKCFGVLQYHLPYTPAYSAYCFSKGKYQSFFCDEPPASTEVDFGEVTVLPELYHTDVDIEGTVEHQPYFLMRCRFNTKPEWQYIVDWYLNGEFNISLGPENEAALDKLTLHETMIDRLGIEITCAVRASIPSDTNCVALTDRSYSPVFYAGIKILTPVITMPKGSRGTINMKTTVPIGCRYKDSDVSSCVTPVGIFDSTTSDYNCGHSHIANIAKQQDKSFCSKGIKSLSIGEKFDPDEIFTFDIATIDQTYEDTEAFILKLEFGPDIGHQKWQNFTFPDIPVRINDTTTYKQKICYSHIDPHMRSSNYHYYENQVEGEYWLYNNTKYKIEVQEKTGSCNGGIATCTCAIAIRAGKDVFTINRCGGINYLGFTRCGDGGILQVVRKNDNMYEVYTPIGTKITIQLFTGSYYGGFMNVDITMAPKDKNNVQGLCGHFDGNRENDLLGRDGITTPLESYPYAFVESWKSPSRSLESWEEQNGLYCTCNQVGTKHVATCAPTQYLKCIKPSSITPTKCRIQGRRKRNAEHNNVKEMNRLFRMMNSGFKHRIVKREESENITAEEATELCTNMINGSLAVRSYGEMDGGENPEAVIDQCIFDVKVGNDRSWANAHVESVNNIVKSMMEYEPTYVANNTEKVEIFFVNTCPGNCSDNGNCTNSGECSCKQYYHGATCSIDERDALVIDDIEGGGVCDMAEGDECVCFTIRSDNILDGYKCKIQATLYFRNGTNHQTQTDTGSGEYEDIFTGVCCDHDYVRSDNEFGLVYDVSISNNGDVYSNIATVHVLNSACQEVDTNAQTPFRLKNQTCFIDGVCFVDGDWSDIQTDTCFICQSSIDAYNWTEQPCPTTTVSTTSSASSSMASMSSTTEMSTATPTSTLTTTEANTDTAGAPSTTSTSTTERETSTTSTVKTSTSTPTTTSPTTKANTDTSSAPSTTKTTTTERETSTTSTVKASTSTQTQTSPTTKANTGTSSAPSTTSKSTTSTVKTSTSTQTPTSPTTKANTDTSSAPSTTSKSTTSAVKTSTSTQTPASPTTEANTDTTSAPSTTSTSTTERETSTTSTIKTSLSTPTSATTEANTDTSSAPSTTSKFTTERETSTTSTVKTPTSTQTLTSPTTEAKSETSRAPSTTSKSTTEREISTTSTVKTSTPTPTSPTTEANTETSSAPSTTSTSTTERETSTTSTVKAPTSTPTPTSPTTEANTETSSLPSTTSTPTTESETSTTSTVQTSSPTPKSLTTEGNTDTSSNTDTPSTSTQEHETSTPQANTVTMGMILGVSAGILILVVIIVAIVNMTLVVRSKNIKHRAVKRKQLGHIATRYTGRYMDKEHPYYY